MKFNALAISGVVADVSQKELGDSSSFQEIIIENSEGSYAVLYECGDTPLSKETISGQVVTVPFELIQAEEFGTYKIKALEFLVKAEPSPADRIRAVASNASSGKTTVNPESNKQAAGFSPSRRAAPSFAKPGSVTQPNKQAAPAGSKVAEAIQSRLTQDLSTPVSDDPRVVIKDEDLPEVSKASNKANEAFEGDAPNWEEVADSGSSEDLVAPQVQSNGRPTFAAAKPGFNPPKPNASRAAANSTFGKKTALTSTTASAAPQKAAAQKAVATPAKTTPTPAARGFAASAKPSKPRPNF